jgi:signal transduction histidine kinase/FtsH-binding integral membrane protein
MVSLLSTGTSPLLPKKEEEEAVRQARMRLLYRGLPFSLGTTLAVTAGVVVIGLQVTPPLQVWLWAAVMLTFTGLRGLLWFQWKHSPRHHDPAFENRFLWATLGSGLAWGSSPFLAFHEAPALHLMFISVVLAGVCGGSLATMGTYPKAAMRLITPTCLGLAVRMFQVEGSLGLVLGLATLLYLIVLKTAVDMTGAIVPEYVITRIRAEAAQDSESRARNLLEDTLRNAPLLLAIFDPSDRLIHANDLYLSVYPPEVATWALGHTHREMVEAAMAGSHFQFKDEVEKKAFAEERIASHSNPGKSSFFKVGDRTYRISDARTAEGGILTLGVDVSLELAQHEALALALDAAKQASQAKTRFLSHMSHELRTPLNAVIGFTDLLLMGEAGEVSPVQASHLGHVKAGATHLLALIEDVMELSRIEGGGNELHHENLQTCEVAEEVLKQMAVQAGKVKVALKRGQMDDATLRSDRKGIQKVLVNYLSNGIKYNHPGGFVRLEGFNLGTGHYRWSVEDDGPGIPQELQLQLFEPFNRLGRESSVIEGTGIGLTFVQRMAEHLGGKVGFSSREGVGSIFWVDLPLSAEAEPGPDPKEA